MSRYTGSINKKSRRLGISLLENNKEFNKGKKRSYAPGQHGTRRRKLSNYGLQLQEKQKMRFLYGLSEKQFRNTFIKARKIQEGILGTNLFILLESRLDNICFRMNLARTRDGARQLVNHGHILVNDQKVDIPSYQVQVNDVISIKEKSRKNKALVESINLKMKTLPFVSFEKEKMTGIYKRHPQRQELNLDIKEDLVVEWYNRLV